MKDLPDRFPAELFPVIHELKLQGRVWLVGGAVRDHLLRKRTSDFDFAVDGDALALARKTANVLKGDYFTLDAARFTGRVLLTNKGDSHITLDFSRIRGENIETDLSRRDFTLNALAIDPFSPVQLIDPTGGFTDLREKLVRACSPDAIADDPVRAIRAVRIASELEFRIDPETISWIREASGWLSQSSLERFRDEIFRILSQAHPEQPLRVLEYLGIGAVIFPFFSGPAGDRWMEAVDRVQRLREMLDVLTPTFDSESAVGSTMGLVSLYLGRFRHLIRPYMDFQLGFGRPRLAHTYFCTLYYRIGDGGTDFEAGINSGSYAADWARWIKLSNDEVKWIERCVRTRWVRSAQQPDAEGDALKIYRYYRDASDAGVSGILIALANFLVRARNAPDQLEWENELENGQRYLSAWFESREKLVDPPRIVRGDELAKELDLHPGPEIGELLESIREAQVVGDVSTKEDALKLVRDLVD